jgi:hypothetical protein
MTIETTINCDALNCFNSIDSSGNDSATQIITENEWHFDPTTEDFQYCKECWPDVQAEYDEMLQNGELS